MTGLTIVLAEPAPARFRTALTMALAARALGGRARLFLDAAAVALVAAPPAEDIAWCAAAGLPALGDLIDDAFAAGVALILCQTGLALAGGSAERCDPRFTYGGMVGLLVDLGDDRLVAI